MFLVTELEPLPERQQFVAVAVAVAILGLVLELVRRRKLREEYSWLWVVTALVLIVLALDGNVLVLASRWIGAAASTSTLFFGAIVFLLLVALQFSVHLSKLAQRQKTLAQRLALLERELEERRPAGAAADAERDAERDADRGSGRDAPAAGTAVPLREPPPVGASRRRAQDEIA